MEKEACDDLDTSILCGGLLKQPLDYTFSLHHELPKQNRVVKLYTKLFVPCSLWLTHFMGMGWPLHQ
jgi:hypothetical protein